MEFEESNLELFTSAGLFGLSARRLWEHVRFHQVNPFPQSPTSVESKPEYFIDVVRQAPYGGVLLGLTLAKLLEGHWPWQDSELRRLIESPLGAEWINGVEQLFQHARQRRAVRNRPDPFLPSVNAGCVGVQGLTCGIRDWLARHHQEKASWHQWARRMEKLRQGGLKQDEAEQSGLIDEFESEPTDDRLDREEKVTGKQIVSGLDYDHLRLSILPYVGRAESERLVFRAVHPQATRKRKKFRPRRGIVAEPRYRDQVLGYWLECIETDDLLNEQPAWIALDHRREPVCKLKSHLTDAVRAANEHAQKTFPKLSVQGKWSDNEYCLTGGEGYREWLVTLPLYPASFRHPQHFPHRNILIHLRTDWREGFDGERILLIQEVQSDWAQRARREKDEATVPVPPWMNEWEALALKLMLLHAVEHKADALAWLPGSSQVDRWRGLGEAGLRELYDKTLPRELNRVLKPHGRTTGVIEAFTPRNFYIEPTELGYVVLDEDREPVGEAHSWREAQALIPHGSHEELHTFHGVVIDDALRSAIQENGFFAWGMGIKG